MPERVQLKRTKGWRMPVNTVSVARPTKWGNPFRVGDPGRFDETHSVVRSARHAVSAFADMVNAPNASMYCVEARRELRGKNLACWCPLDQPCHADVLLELANAAPGGRE